MSPKTKQVIVHWCEDTITLKGSVSYAFIVFAPANHRSSTLFSCSIWYTVTE